jgi:hypothetical protein
MTFVRVLLVLSLLPIVSAHAYNCGKSVALLGSEPEFRREFSRKEVLAQIVRLYDLAINDLASMEVAEKLMQQLAEREGRTFKEILKEVESQEVSPVERRAVAEQQRAHREQEQAELFEGLRPYLDRIGREHRGIIEETLIRPGLVYPLSTGEVEFRFKGSHLFTVGDEHLNGEGKGKTEIVSFGIGDDFAIGQVPVTQLLYFLAALGEKSVDATPSFFRLNEGAVSFQLGKRSYSLKPNHPVESLNYHEARNHAVRVSKLTGLPYGLPTETQWEFANRAGSESAYHFGNDGSELLRYARFGKNAGGETHAVGGLLPNGFHLYDTHGNVSEFTSSEIGSDVIVRGGDWNDRWEEDLRTSRRFSYCRHDAGITIGFRLKRQSSGNARPSHIFTFGAAAEPKTETSSLNERGQ